jgi:hypothetical protein
MRWLKAFLVALILLTTWTSFAFVSTSWHKLVFKIVPVDEPYLVSGIGDWGRESFDWGITQSFFGQNLADWHVPADEVSHMADVRRVWLGLVAFSILGLGWLFITKPVDVYAKASLVVGLIGLTTAISFEPAFLLMHQLFFPKGNWEFSPQSSLVQIYPEAFFVWMWGTIVAASGLTLLMAFYFHKPKGYSREPR